jgi:hypothetical protein
MTSGTSSTFCAEKILLTPVCVCSNRNREWPFRPSAELKGLDKLMEKTIEPVAKWLMQQELYVELDGAYFCVVSKRKLSRLG